jgi:hypothetical protein
VRWFDVFRGLALRGKSFEEIVEFFFCHVAAAIQREKRVSQLPVVGAELLCDFALTRARSNMRQEVLRGYLIF